MRGIALGLLGATSLLALSANGARAADLAEPTPLALIVSGLGETWSGYTFIDDTHRVHPDEESFGSGGGNGRLSIPLGANFSIQGDFNIEYNSTLLTDDDDDESRDNFQASGQGGTHVSWRDPNVGLIGGFVAVGQGEADESSQAFLAFGGEAQGYFGPFTLYGQGGALNPDTSFMEVENEFRDAFFGRAVARYFFGEQSFLGSDNRLQAEFAYVTGDIDDDGEEEGRILEWGARYDFTLENLPIVGETHLFLGYRGAKFENLDDDDRFMDHTIYIGSSHSFGGPTMQDFDRTGATLDLPNFGRWSSSGQIIR
jgi:hypothetical protein